VEAAGGLTVIRRFKAGAFPHPVFRRPRQTASGMESLYGRIGKLRVARATIFF